MRNWLASASVCAVQDSFKTPRRVRRKRSDVETELPSDSSEASGGTTRHSVFSRFPQGRQRASRGKRRREQDGEYLQYEHEYYKLFKVSSKEPPRSEVQSPVLLAARVAEARSRITLSLYIACFLSVVDPLSVRF